jgi:hypothetical protein
MTIDDMIVKCSDLNRIEITEASTIAATAFQDRQPAQSRLRAFQNQELKEFPSGRNDLRRTPSRMLPRAPFHGEGNSHISECSFT